MPEADREHAIPSESSMESAATEEPGSSFRCRWYYFPPLAHVCTCALVAGLPNQVGVEPLVWIDFPASILILAATWSSDYPVLVFGILGSLWWYLVSRSVDIWRLRLIGHMRAKVKR